MSNENSAIHGWMGVIVVIGALPMAIGAVIALFRPAVLVSPCGEINAAVHVYAGYLFARNLALRAALIAGLALRAKGM